MYNLTYSHIGFHFPRVCMRPCLFYAVGGGRTKRQQIVLAANFSMATEEPDVTKKKEVKVLWYACIGLVRFLVECFSKREGRKEGRNKARRAKEERRKKLNL